MLIKLFKIIKKRENDDVAVIFVNNQEMFIHESEDTATCLEDGFKFSSEAGPPTGNEIIADEQYVGKPFIQFYLNKFVINLHMPDFDYTENNCREYTVQDLENGIEINYHEGKFK